MTDLLGNEYNRIPNKQPPVYGQPADLFRNYDLPAHKVSTHLLAAMISKIRISAYTEVSQSDNQLVVFITRMVMKNGDNHDHFLHCELIDGEWYNTVK